jgi:4-amino-4-deoxy-L-arabinose transferase-like glycosyltransferase
MNFFKNRKIQLIIIFFVALLIRICVMIALEGYVFRSEYLNTYGYNNAMVAANVALGKGFSLRDISLGIGWNDSKPTALVPPGYVYFIALMFHIFGIYSVKAAIAIEVFQSLTDAFTCVIFYHLGKRFDEKVGLLASIGFALYPAAVFFSVMRIGPAPVVVLLLAIIMLYLLRIQEHQRYVDAIACGLLMGINALLEPTVILFYVLGCVWLFYWSMLARSAALKNSLVMGLVCIVCLLPWTIRNFLVFDTFVPIKAALGRNLLEGNSPYSTGVIHNHDYAKAFSPEEFKRLEKLDAVSIDKAMLEKAVFFIKADPKGFIRSTLKRIYYFWSFTDPYRETSYDSLRIVTYGPVFILAIIGIFLAKKKLQQTSLLLSLFLSYPLTYYIAHVSINRYRYIVEPFLIILSSYTVINLYKKIVYARHASFASNMAN